MEGQLVGVTHRNLDALVCDELRRWIISERLAPGTRLVESTIAEELGVSRGPVREAIRQLEREGFVVLSPRRGATVASMSPEDALACYEVRIALEQVAARLAAQRRTEEDLDALRAVVDRGQETVAAGRWDVLAQLNNEFHAVLARTSRNAELPVLMDHYSKRITWMFSRSAEQRGAAAWEEHARIVDAVRAGDGALAALVAGEHIDRSRKEYVVAMGIDVDAAES